VRTVQSADGTSIVYYSLGDGPSVILFGGAMRTAVDYMPLAEAMGERTRVHVVDRRGRGSSGPLGPSYSIDREREDLLAVQAATGARSVFGHSYGGLVVLRTAANTDVFHRIAVYEPGVSLGRSIRTDWLPRYQELLDRQDTRGAFAYFVQQSGHAPKAVTHLPLWYLRWVMRVVVRGEQWERFEPLLRANLLEHQQVAACDGPVDQYAAIQAQILLLAGSQSPSSSGRQLVDTLRNVIPCARTTVLDGLDHNAPDEKAPVAVADQLIPFFTSETADVGRQRPSG
jgi:pimeloyl-ACP methyl ester carboxylesterase